MTDKALSPCPFCAATLKAYTTHRGQEQFWAHPASKCVLSGFTVAPDAITAWNTRVASSDRADLVRRCEEYRDCFDEITAKARPFCGDASDPEKVTGYTIATGPIHRAAGKLGHQMFNMGERFASLQESLVEYERAVREEVIPQIERDLRERARQAAVERLHPIARATLNKEQSNDPG